MIVDISTLGYFVLGAFLGALVGRLVTFGIMAIGLLFVILK